MKKATSWILGPLFKVLDQPKKQAQVRKICEIVAAEKEGAVDRFLFLARCSCEFWAILSEPGEVRKRRSVGKGRARHHKLPLIVVVVSQPLVYLHHTSPIHRYSSCRTPSLVRSAQFASLTHTPDAYLDALAFLTPNGFCDHGSDENLWIFAICRTQDP